MTRGEMESRRLAAAEDLRAGTRQADVGRKYGTTRTTASRWGRAVREGRSLRRRIAPGRTPRCDRVALVAILRECRDLTYAQATEVVERRLGVRYDPDHLARVGLEAIGRKPQPAGGER